VLLRLLFDHPGCSITSTAVERQESSVPESEAWSRGECPGGPWGSGGAGICLFMQEKDITAKPRVFHPDHSLSEQLIEMDRRRKREIGEHKAFKTNSEEVFQ